MHSEHSIVGIRRLEKSKSNETTNSIVGIR